MQGQQIALVTKDLKYLGRIGKVLGSNEKQVTLLLPCYKFPKLASSNIKEDGVVRGDGFVNEYIQLPATSVALFSLNGQTETYQLLGDTFVRTAGERYGEVVSDLERDLAGLGINLQFG